MSSFVWKPPVSSLRISLPPAARRRIAHANLIGPKIILGDLTDTALFRRAIEAVRGLAVAVLICQESRRFSSLGSLLGVLPIDTITEKA